MTQPNRRPGAQPANLNSMKSGRYSRRIRVGRWRGISAARPELKALEERAERLVSQLTQSVVDTYGRTSVADAAAIDACARKGFLVDRILQIVAAGELNSVVEVDFLRLAAVAADDLHRIIRKDLRLDGNQTQTNLQERWKAICATEGAA